MSKSTDDLLRDLHDQGILDDPAATLPVERRSAPVEARPKQDPGAPRDKGVPTSLVIVLVAFLIAVISSIPFGDYALYPFSLFVTLVHESSHALAAVLTGGSVDSIGISSDLSGVTTTSGGLSPIIDSAGYFGASVAGAALLLSPLRFARWAIGALAAIPVACLVFFHPDSAFTALWCVVFAATLGLAAWKLRLRYLAFLQVLIGAEAALNAVRDVLTLLFISTSGSHMQTDATNMSRDLFLPSTFWAVLWTAVSVVLLLASLGLLIRRDFPTFRFPSVRHRA